MCKKHKYVFGVIAVLVGVVSVPLLTPTRGTAQETGAAIEAAGFVFRTLSSEDLDIIEKASGYRVGVQVVEVKAGSPAAQAGVKAGDVIMAIGKTGVDSAEAAVQALKDASGTVEVMAFTQSADGYASATYSLNLSEDTSGSSSQPAASGSAAVGWQLETLPQEALDKIEKETGHRFGVVVVQVTPESPAAQAGIRAGDIILVVGKTGVDSTEAVEQALAGQSGQIAILGLRPGEEQFETLQCTMTLPVGESPGVGAQNDPVSAYFDMLDFIRSQAWGRPVSSSADVREKAAMQLQQALPNMNQETQNAVLQVPEMWAGIQKQWAELSDEKKAEQRESWRKQLLLPGQFIAIVTEKMQTLGGENGKVALECPEGWVVAQTQSGDRELLYLGPPKTETSWSAVMNGATTPAGALFALVPAGQMGSNSWLERARLIAQQVVTTNAPDMKEIAAFEVGQGAIIAFLGHYPGQAEEKFFWVGILPFGSGYFAAGRMGGPSTEAEALVPVFQHMLDTMKLAPPGEAAGSDSFNLAWDEFQSKTAASTWKAWGAGTSY